MLGKKKQKKDRKKRRKRQEKERKNRTKKRLKKEGKKRGKRGREDESVGSHSRALPVLGETWQQSRKKRGLKVPQEIPRRAQTSPKTPPKRVQNPSNINLKEHSKNMVFRIDFFMIFCFFDFKIHRFL